MRSRTATSRGRSCFAARLRQEQGDRRGRGDADHQPRCAGHADPRQRDHRHRPGAVSRCGRGDRRLDNREARLWVNRCCWKVGTPWIDGGIQEISGVAKVFVPPDGACYECAMTENDYRLINLRYSCPLLKREDLLAGKVPTAPTIACMIGGLQVQEALKLIHGLPVEAGTGPGLERPGQQLLQDRTTSGRKTASATTPIASRSSCRCRAACHRRRAVRRRGHALRHSNPKRKRGSSTTDAAPRPRPGRLARLRLRQQAAGHAAAAARRRRRSQMPRMRPDSPSPISNTRSTPARRWRKKSSARLGIPPYDIVRVGDDQQEQVFLLAGDRERIMGLKGTPSVA